MSTAKELFRAGYYAAAPYRGSDSEYRWLQQELAANGISGPRNVSKAALRTRYINAMVSRGVTADEAFGSPRMSTDDVPSTIDQVSNELEQLEIGEEVRAPTPPKMLDWAGGFTLKSNLTHKALNKRLRSLGLATTGTVEEKRDRLRRAEINLQSAKSMPVTATPTMAYGSDLSNTTVPISKLRPNPDVVREIEMLADMFQGKASIGRGRKAKSLSQAIMETMVGMPSYQQLHGVLPIIMPSATHPEPGPSSGKAYVTSGYVSKSLGTSSGDIREMVQDFLRNSSKAVLGLMVETVETAPFLPGLEDHKNARYKRGGDASTEEEVKWTLGDVPVPWAGSFTDKYYNWRPTHVNAIVVEKTADGPLYHHFEPHQVYDDDGTIQTFGPRGYGNKERAIEGFMASAGVMPAPDRACFSDSVMQTSDSMCQTWSAWYVYLRAKGMSNQDAIMYMNRTGFFGLLEFMRAVLNVGKSKYAKIARTPSRTFEDYYLKSGAVTGGKPLPMDEGLEGDFTYEMRERARGKEFGFRTAGAFSDISP